MNEYTKYRLDVRYDGTEFHGWQRQDDVRTVQEELEVALEQLFQEQPAVHGASRTDAGVHALHQVAHFRVKKSRPPDQVVSALNHHLPKDVSVHDAKQAHHDFQAHIDATGKTYVYVLLNRRVPPALFRAYMYWLVPELDRTAMREAITSYIGEHNYLGFATNASDVENPICRITSARLRTSGSHVIFGFTGDRFLYNMVRTMVGTLIEVGKGDRPPSHVETLLDEGDRKQAGPVVPARGLYLRQVHYDDIDGVELDLSSSIEDVFGGC